MRVQRGRHPYRFTQAECLAFERASTTRHEYIDGVIYALDDGESPQAMAGESEAHGQITVNLVPLLHAHLRGGPYQAFTQNMKVRLGPNSLESARGFYAYPDVVVVYGVRQYHDQAHDVLLNPTLLIKVLSPSTKAFDRGEKFQGYWRYLPPLTTYLLVAQDQPTIDHYARDASGIWTLHTMAGREERLHVAALDWTVALSDVYERVVFSR